MTKIKDTDYLFISARIRALELKLLTHERQERMLEAKSAGEAMKVLTECGYPDSGDLDSILAAEREITFKDLYEFSPNKLLIDVLKIKYDYHNLKVLIKSEAANINAERLLSPFGRIEPKSLTDAYRTGDYGGMTATMKAACDYAANILATTGDPQLADFELDKAYYGEMRDCATESGSSFLAGYIKLLIDVANLKTTVRACRLGKQSELLKSALIDGGNTSIDYIRRSIPAGTSVADVFSSTSALKAAAELGAEAINGGRQTAFERECDNVLNEYMQPAKRQSFGDAVLLGYATAKEAEQTAVRIIIAGKQAGMPSDEIRERLRVTYV